MGAGRRQKEENLLSEAVYNPNADQANYAMQVLRVSTPRGKLDIRGRHPAGQHNHRDNQVCKEPEKNMEALMVGGWWFHQMLLLL